MSPDAEVHALVETVRVEIAQGADAVLTAAEAALNHLGALRQGDAKGLDRAEQSLCVILQACAFQDLAGQRLTRLDALMTGQACGDPLLNGPALAGAGLDQAAADALFAEPDA